MQKLLLISSPSPRLSLATLTPQTMETGVIAEWLKKEGELVKSGDVMAKIETDKATVDFEATDEVIMAKIIVPAGSTVSVGQPICITVEEAGDVASFASYTVPGAVAKVVAAPLPAVVQKTAPAPAPLPAPIAAPIKSAPVTVAAPIAKSLPPAAAVTSASSSISTADYVAWPAWGLSLSKSPLGFTAAKAQAAYTAAYGFSGVALEDEPVAAKEGDKKSVKK